MSVTIFTLEDPVAVRHPYLVSKQVVFVIHICVRVSLRKQFLHKLHFVWVFTNVALEIYIFFQMHKNVVKTQMISQMQHLIWTYLWVITKCDQWKYPKSCVQPCLSVFPVCKQSLWQRSLVDIVPDAGDATVSSPVCAGCCSWRSLPAVRAKLLCRI